MRGLIITYIVDSDSMTNEEFEDQEERTVSFSRDQLQDILEDHIELKRGERIDWTNSFIDSIS